jgi:hypothetical protein
MEAAEFLFGAVIGFVVAIFLLLIALPDRKQDCDTFGMTRFSNRVYVCHPK